MGNGIVIKKKPRSSLSILKRTKVSPPFLCVCVVGGSVWGRHVQINVYKYQTNRDVIYLPKKHGYFTCSLEK